MARCAVAARASAVSTAVRGPSLYATANVRPQIRLIEVYNTTAVACPIALAIASATGTQGAGLTEVCLSDSSKTVVATGFNTHTADATVGSPFRYGDLGAFIGAGIVWTWGPGELIIPNATTAGVVIILPAGTGQIFDYAIEWDE